MDVIGVFKEIILRNELGGNVALAYRFSDPDGVRTGKSGWSFGVCQFDISHNPAATLCLRECGFTTDEIAGLKAQTIAIGPMNPKLAASKATVDTWDDKQLFECLTVPYQMLSGDRIKVASQSVNYHVADYHNQFYMSRGGKMHTFLRGLGRPVTAGDIIRFKLGLPWGKKRPDDVQRRWENIEAVCAEMGVDR